MQGRWAILAIVAALLLAAQQAVRGQGKDASQKIQNLVSQKEDVERDIAQLQTVAPSPPLQPVTPPPP